jgi:hypothetical protein
MLLFPSVIVLSVGVWARAGALALARQDRALGDPGSPHVG